jgi:ParB family transcriptional regulator, chromosome partitioning protein
VGRSRSAASNLLRLLNLAEPVQQMLLAGDLDMGHARALLALAGAQQITAATEVAARKLSVREAEKLVARLAAHGGARRRCCASRRRSRATCCGWKNNSPTAWPPRWRSASSARRAAARQGEIAIAFGSLDELNGLLHKLGAGDG